MIFARVYEQRNASREMVPTQHQRQAACTTFKPLSATAVPTEGGVPSDATTETLQFMPTEIAQHRKDGCCFRYHDMFTNGYKMVCKQLFIIEVVGNDDDPPPPDDTEAPTIDLHALTGIRLCSGHTMQLNIIINGTHLTALLDSGSTHNFVDVEAATCVGIHLGAPSASTLPSPTRTASQA
jgi:hypothetical protein